MALIGTVGFCLVFYMAGLIGILDALEDVFPRFYAHITTRELRPEIPEAVFTILVLLCLRWLAPLDAIDAWIADAALFGTLLYLSTRLHERALYIALLTLTGIINWTLWGTHPGSLVPLVILMVVNSFADWFNDHTWDFILMTLVVSAVTWGTATWVNAWDLVEATIVGVIVTVTMIASHWYGRLVVSRQQQGKRLRYSSNHDELTGIRSLHLFRRDYRTYQRLMRSNPDAHLTLVMIDLDHFKQINDTYGHLTGNEVLITFARDIEAYLVAMPYFCGVYRTGGEEFSVFLYELTDAEAKEAIDAYIKRLRDLVVMRSYPEKRITLSVGMSRVHGYDEPLKQAIARTDAKLYEAKHGGRNRVAQQTGGQTAMAD
ncbi:Signal transduction diguanylate cyclase [Lacticaseibacillus thailandensis DSM 22698 = JCM 13996]|uniref:Signal transduction diguanylate cyclase n=2 Tax=Lacticaseibacillus thailandensis TaxID=381741 RepID=A0A0R2C955_9LACO|nr:Signal transduction diguanylate cyclase [Lacticaseibacillus thailandensis DSM 22698 = JCM 13996]